MRPAEGITKIMAMLDEAAFTALAEGYRRQLQVHCYRMLGSLDEAEDLVQETFLRAWRGRQAFEGRAQVRTWLYRIATNACLNALERGPRRIVPRDVAPPVTALTDTSNAPSEPPWAPELPWLQPIPDELLPSPEHEVVEKETIELVYLAALQHLPPRQRAILILRDALGWSANEVAGLLDTTAVSVNSALQRAHATMRAQLPTGRHEWHAVRPASDVEQSLLQRFMHAWERADAAALTSLLREDALWAMPPAPLWFSGRVAIERLFTQFPLGAGREFRTLATAANRQPAAAGYMRLAGWPEFRFVGVHVLRIEGDQIAEVTAFGPELCRAFDVPAVLR
jgi:RNA polymerase sigma-70 factor, ECF subfamily